MQTGVYSGTCIKRAMQSWVSSPKRDFKVTSTIRCKISVMGVWDWSLVTGQCSQPLSLKKPHVF